MPKYGDAAAMNHGMKYVVRIQGTTFSAYCNTEENAQQVAKGLMKLPKKSLPSNPTISRLGSEEQIGLRDVQGELSPRRYEDVACPRCHAPRREKCNAPNGGTTSPHADRKKASKHS